MSRATMRPTETRGHLRVLVADDDERSLDSLVALLALDGFAIESFLGGLDALARLGVPCAGTAGSSRPGPPRAPLESAPPREATPSATVLPTRGTPPPVAPGIDFLVLDYNMPDLTGIEVLRRLRIRFSAPPPPAILVSGESSRELERSWLDAGGFALLPKPVVPDEFRREVRRLLRRFFGGRLDPI